MNNISHSTKNVLLIFFLFIQIILKAQAPVIEKIEPPNWWTGMKWNKVQLMVYGKNLSGLNAEFANKTIKIDQIRFVENPSYVFIDIEIPEDAKAGRYTMMFSNESGTAQVKYDLQKRNFGDNRHQGFTNEDVIYLLMPDRFANSVTSNDYIEGYTDSMQHITAQQRKGGDLQGISDKLNYFNELGITALWITPVIENNTFRSYHGYSATDHYLVDPRLGTNELYKTLVNKAHEKGIKVIMDHVANHISVDHPWMKNLPEPTWINGTVAEHLPANHNKMVFADIYRDSLTIRAVQEGWFTSYMPDLNHQNPFVRNYIIQNTLWWIEFSGVDGIREDTYPYCDQEFMSVWAEAIQNEYPRFTILAEVWTGEPAFLSSYQAESFFPKEYDTKIKSITDFAMRDAYVNFLSGKKNIYHIYNTLSHDFLYPHPEKLVTFVDNHDVGRAMFFADTNIARFKLVYQLLLTTRGIPQIFYGTELGMIQNEDHGTLRKTFPGGFPGDERNAFTAGGRTEYENDIFNFLSKLLHLRKNYKSLSTGKLTHFPPRDDLYVYIKTLDGQTVLNIINASEKSVQFEPERHLPDIGIFKSATELLTDQQLKIDGNLKITVESMTGKMLLLKR